MTDYLPVCVVTNDIVAAVTITNKETTIGSKRDICGAKAAALSPVSRSLADERSGVSIGLNHGSSLFPDDVALECCFGDVSLVVAQVQELFTGFHSNVDPMPTPMKLSAKRVDKLSFRIKHRDGVDDLLRFGAMFDIDVSPAVDSNTMCFLPWNTFWCADPVVVHFIAVALRSNDDRPGT